MKNLCVHGKRILARLRDPRTPPPASGCTGDSQGGSAPLVRRELSPQAPIRQTPAAPHLFLPRPCKSATDPASPVSLRIRDQRAYVVSEPSAGFFASRAIHSFRTLIVSVWPFFTAH